MTKKINPKGLTPPSCAAEHGFIEVYSNDRHFLTTAPLFGLRGVNVIG
jgi:hypothetical protein